MKKTIKKKEFELIFFLVWLNSILFCLSGILITSFLISDYGTMFFYAIPTAILFMLGYRFNKFYFTKRL